MSVNRLIALLAAPIVAVLLLAGCASTPPASPAQSPAASEAASANAADEMFAAMMIPHHEQAVQMSDMLLSKSGVAPEVADLAQRIKDAQGPEIALMKEWLRAWGSTMDGSDMSGMDGGAMGGMMSQADMAALENADGAEASRLFLEGMIAHHEGAIEMAQTELDGGRNPDALKLAQTIIDTQTAEIAEMKRLLGKS